MKTVLKFSLGLAVSLSLFVLLMQPAQAANRQVPTQVTTIEAKGDKPAPVSPKPIGPPKSAGED